MFKEALIRGRGLEKTPWLCLGRADPLPPQKLLILVTGSPRAPVLQDAERGKVFVPLITVQTSRTAETQRTAENTIPKGELPHHEWEEVAR